MKCMYCKDDKARPIRVVNSRLGGGWQVSCTKCGASSSIEKTREKAIRAWMSHVSGTDIAEGIVKLTVQGMKEAIRSQSPSGIETLQEQIVVLKRLVKEFGSDKP